ncbi:MAG: hypothetical protein AB2651_20840, partial [Candidatus Thiodiazotropha sp.]
MAPLIIETTPTQNAFHPGIYFDASDYFLTKLHSWCKLSVYDEPFYLKNNFTFHMALTAWLSGASDSEHPLEPMVKAQ